MDQADKESDGLLAVPQESAPLDESSDRVTILMPAFNEQDIIGDAVTEWHQEVVSKLPAAQLLIIDDCSTDGTEAVLAQLCKTLPRVNYLRRERNGGHGKALLFGFGNVRTEFVFQTDSDRQHDPAEFWPFWKVRNETDFVFGVRIKRQDGGFRRVVTTLMRILNWVVWQVWISDANCPFKLMKCAALQIVLDKIPEDAFIPMVMVSILSRRMGFRVAEVSVIHLPRRGGTQSLKGVIRWVRVVLICTRQLLRLRLLASARSS